jgi:hypothetical protein
VNGYPLESGNWVLIFAAVVAGPELIIVHVESALNGAGFAAVAVVDEGDGCEENGDCIVETLCIVAVGVCTGTPLKCMAVAEDGMMRGWMLGFPPDV